MSNTSKLVGIVVDKEPTLDRTVHNENFYRIMVNFNGVTIPVLYSEYNVKNRELDGKVEITGCLASDVKRGQIPKFYIYANSIEEADVDTEPTCTVDFNLKITKSKGLQQNKQGKDILPLVCSTSNPISGTSVIYLCLMNNAARRLQSTPMGYTIEGRGDLHAFRDIYEVYATDVEIQ